MNVPTKPTQTYLLDKANETIRQATDLLVDAAATLDDADLVHTAQRIRDWLKGYRAPAQPAAPTPRAHDFGQDSDCRNCGEFGPYAPTHCGDPLCDFEDCGVPAVPEPVARILADPDCAAPEPSAVFLLAKWAVVARMEGEDSGSLYEATVAHLAAPEPSAAKTRPGMFRQRAESAEAQLAAAHLLLKRNTEFLVNYEKHYFDPIVRELRLANQALLTAPSPGDGGEHNDKT